MSPERMATTSSAEHGANWTVSDCGNQGITQLLVVLLPLGMPVARTSPRRAAGFWSQYCSNVAQNRSTLPVGVTDTSCTTNRPLVRLHPPKPATSIPGLVASRTEVRVAPS